ncbi:MAG: DUF4013 domain-containing protein [Deltaproteobacteria bacterium]|nr:DUF4013 domain-containing protein [Deltaproteobacteria bacterium]
MQSFPQQAKPPYGDPPAEQGIEYFAALKFIFSQQNAWSSILLLTVLLFIPVVGQIVMYGWQCEILQRLERRDPKPIPEFSFSDFTHYLSRGVTPFVTQILLTMPFSVVFGALGGISAMVAMVATRGMHHTRGEPPWAVLSVYGVVMLLSLASAPFIAILMNAGLVRAELTEDLGKTLSFSALLAYIKRTWATTFVASFLYGLLASFVILLGLLCCYFGLFPASIIVATGMVHLRFQIYQKYLARGGDPIPVKPPVQLPSEQASTS